MDPIVLLIVVGVLGGVGLLMVGAVQTVSHSKSPMERRLNDIKRRSPIERELGEGAAEESQMSLAEREESQHAPRRADLLPLVTRLLSASAVGARLERDLREARSNWRASELIYLSFFLMAIAFLVMFLILKNIVLALLLSLPALMFPWVYVRRLRTKYLRRFGAQLADTLVLMSNALRSGYSFMQAVEMIAREADPPISDEFKHINDEIQVGKTVEEAMENFSERIPSTDVNLVVMAVLIQREVGGALAEILDTIAAVIRERVQIQGEIQTLTTQGRMSGMFLAFMPIALGAVINLMTKAMGGGGGESYMGPLFNTTAGKWMIAIGICMQLIGFFVIRKIVTIEV